MAESRVQGVSRGGRGVKQITHAEMSELAEEIDSTPLKNWLLREWFKKHMAGRMLATDENLRKRSLAPEPLTGSIR